ncbi:hypothetical protein [Microbispora bryophytorum]|uniref:hypothetical protein n=1 Tax=Microbispora bryophytorum TaxID=1460882 RepID=UPI0033DBC7FA
MADFIPNVALGRVVELYNRVKTGDPSGSALVVVALEASTIETDAVLRDMDSLADILAGATNEATNSGYARKVLTAADLATYAPDDTNDRADLDIPDQVWTSVLAGDSWAKLVICYRPDSGSPDSAVIPLSVHDFPIIPDGTDVVAQIATGGFYRATNSAA